MDRDAAALAHRPAGRGAGLGLAVDFAAGEEMRTEISAKFREPKVAAELDRGRAAAGVLVDRRAGDFALSLAMV